MFPWLVGELRAERAKTCLLLGDLTDAKDYHSAQLVNRVVASIKLLSSAVERVIILRGNHDFLKDGHVFFEFLSALPGVEVIVKPTEDLVVGDSSAFFLPYSKAPARDWAGMDFSHYQYLFMHQTVKGAIASNGQQMDGDALPLLNAGKVWSGDIHVPQTIGPVEYVGSPYAVHFGDAFRPRCVALDAAGVSYDLHYPSPARLMVDVSSIKELEERLDMLRLGDQVKVRIHLSEAEKHEWQGIRHAVLQTMRDASLELCGLELKVSKARHRVRVGQPERARYSPEEALYRFVKADELGGDLYEVGLECMQ